MLVLSRALVPEGPSAVLRLSYQLRDAGGGTAVDTTGVTLSPRLAFAAATDPSLVKVDANATHALPDCAAAGGGRLADPASGIGECSVVVEARFFPSAGSVDATITLQIMFGCALLCCGANKCDATTAKHCFCIITLLVCNRLIIPSFAHHQNKKNKGPTSSARPRPSRSSSWRPPTTLLSCPAAPA
jgi:hypothetical protein